MRTRTLSPGLWPCAAVVALALAGCGGSSEPDKAPAGKPALTHAQFVTRANAACRLARTRAVRLERPKDLVGYARVARSLATLASRARDRISVLEPPAADRGAADVYLAALDAPIRELRRVRVAAYKENHAEVERRVRRFRALSRRADRLADALGLRVCGTGG